MEIERKYLVKKIPFELDSFEMHEIIQCYLNPIQKGVERRTRKKNGKYFYTEKTFGNLVREEFEKEISENEFFSLLKEQINYTIKKDRYHIPFNNFLIELDVYKDQLQGLVTADVEYNSVKESEDFIPPVWFSEEITYEEKYKNFYLSKIKQFK